MTTIRQACEAVVNASPSDYEAACEVWTRVCTPQAVLAALKQLEAERDQYQRAPTDPDIEAVVKDVWGDTIRPGTRAMMAAIIAKLKEAQ